MTAGSVENRLSAQESVGEPQGNVKPPARVHAVQGTPLQRETHIHFQAVVRHRGIDRHVGHHKRRLLLVGQVALSLEQLLELLVRDVRDVDELPLLIPQVESARLDLLDRRRSGGQRPRRRQLLADSPSGHSPGMLVRPISVSSNHQVRTAISPTKRHVQTTCQLFRMRMRHAETSQASSLGSLPPPANTFPACFPPGLPECSSIAPSPSDPRIPSVTNAAQPSGSRRRRSHTRSGHGPPHI